MFFGLTLIIVGGVFFLQNIGVISAGAGDVIWPLVVVVLGITFLSKKHRGNCLCCGTHWGKKKEE